MAFTMSYRDPDAAKPVKPARAAAPAKAPRPSRNRVQDKAQAQAEAVFSSHPANPDAADKLPTAEQTDNVPAPLTAATEPK